MRDAHGDALRWQAARWGLVPFWAKDASIGHKMINARAETVAEKPAFRKPFRSRRCLIPADGFFEWQRHGDTREAWYFRSTAGTPLAFAGLWDEWLDKSTGETLRSCTIITTAANALMRPIHDRMPVVLQAHEERQWLDDDRVESLHALLQPEATAALAAYRVSDYVNNPRHEGPQCIAELS